MPSQGLFITFEGTEGAGKSTLIRILASRFEKMGRRYVVTREPGGSPLGENIRAVVLAESMGARTELLLYQAARADHVERIIRPALERGMVVLCDRFTDSTLAYQAEARGLKWKEVESLNQYATQGLKPALTVWLDIDPKVGLLRAADPNRFEAEGVKFQAQVRKGFEKARKKNPKRWLKLDARSATPEQLAEKVIEELQWRRKLR